MITNYNDSLLKLRSFFNDTLTETLENGSTVSMLSLPDLIRAETNSGNDWWNSIILNETNPSLQIINMPNLEQSPYILTSPNLKEINLDSLVQVEFGEAWNGGQQFYTTVPPKVLQNTKLKSLVLPNFVGTVYPTSRDVSLLSDTRLNSTAFIENYWLQEVILGNEKMFQDENSYYYFNGYWFNNNYFLQSLQLNYPYVIPIMKPQFFINNPIANGSGYIFVPDNLYDDYIQATGWQTLNAKIKRKSQKNLYTTNEIEDSWETIIANCKNGNISKYNIGDTKTVIIDGAPIPFTIVGKLGDSQTEYMDPLHSSYSGYTTSSDGKARLAWLEKTISHFTPMNLNENSFNNNASYNNAVLLHSILNTIYDTIEPTVKNGIVPVVKYSRGYSSVNNNTIADLATTEPEYLWIPSAIELNKASQYNNATIHYVVPENLNYCLGYTNINQINNNYIKVALRDYSQSSRTSPDFLQASSANPNQMGVISSSGDSSAYLILGFCT